MNKTPQIKCIIHEQQGVTHINIGLNKYLNNFSWYFVHTIVPWTPLGTLSRKCRDKMAAISQTTLSNAFSRMKMLEFLLRFHWNLFLMVQLTIFQHWFRLWLGAVQATSHYLNQWWLVYWRIYASFGLNELSPSCDGVMKGSGNASFLSMKCTWKCRLPNSDRFVLISISVRFPVSDLNGT